MEVPCHKVCPQRGGCGAHLNSASHPYISQMLATCHSAPVAGLTLAQDLQVLLQGNPGAPGIQHQAPALAAPCLISETVVPFLPHRIWKYHLTPFTPTSVFLTQLPKEPHCSPVLEAGLAPHTLHGLNSQ